MFVFGLVFCLSIFLRVLSELLKCAQWNFGKEASSRTLSLATHQV